MTPTETVAQQLEALRTGAGIFPLTDRGLLRITGPDATRWLNGMVTNSIQSLQPGEGNYNFLLNAQGRIQGDCMIYREPGNAEPTFLLQTENAQLETIHRTLDRFIIMDDVELHPVQLSGVLIAGPHALSIVTSLDDKRHNIRSVIQAVRQQGHAPQNATIGPVHAWLIEAATVCAGVSVSVVCIQSPLLPHVELWSDAATITSIVAELRATRAVVVSPETMEALRILSARPKFGQDIRDRDLPQETAQTHALHFAKGCYLGQEIVERIRSRGQVHRTFTAFTLEGDPPTLPAPLEANGKAAGELTSAMQIGDRIHALGYARREFLEAHTPLTYLGGTAQPKTPTHLSS